MSIATQALLGLVIGLTAAVVTLLLAGVFVGLATILGRRKEGRTLRVQLAQAKVISGWRRS